MQVNIKYLGYRDDTEWPHYAWSVTIGSEQFDYRTGSGHGTPIFKKGSNFQRNLKPTQPCLVDSGRKEWVLVPRTDQVLDCLFLDSDAGSESFDSFCSNFGYSNDSLKALDTYRACMDTAARLKRALGSEYTSELSRISKLREEGIL